MSAEEKDKKDKKEKEQTDENTRAAEENKFTPFSGAAPFPHKNHHGEKFNRVLSEGREPGEHVRRTVLGHDRDVSVRRVIVFRIFFFFFFFFFFFDECREGLRRCHKSRKNEYDDKSDDDEDRRRRGFSDDEKVFFDVTETHALAKLLLEPRERAAARAAAKFNPFTSLRVETVPSVHQRFTLRR